MLYALGFALFCLLILGGILIGTRNENRSANEFRLRSHREPL